MYYCSIQSVNAELGFPGPVREGGSEGEAGPTSRRVIVGSGFVREPADATPRYTAWLNKVGCMIEILYFSCDCVGGRVVRLFVRMWGRVDVLFW